MAGCGVDVGGDDIGLHLVAVHVDARTGVRIGKSSDRLSNQRMLDVVEEFDLPQYGTNSP
jgi:uncharacterized protein YwlG (UPF0340 family)